MTCGGDQIRAWGGFAGDAIMNFIENIINMDRGK